MPRFFWVREEESLSTSISGGRLSAVLVSGFLGFFMLFAVGFAEVAHDAAHDTRHAVAFPCH